MEVKPNSSKGGNGISTTGINTLGLVSKQSGLSSITKTSMAPTVVTREYIQDSTDRDIVVGCHEEFVRRLNAMDETAFQSLSKDQFSITTMHSAYPAVQLTKENAVDIKTLSNQTGKVLEGKFLLCRTITPAAQLRSIATVVEDPEGKYAMRVVFGGYSSSEPKVTDFNKVLPPGSFLAIKNPLFKTEALRFLSLRCPDPTQVELLSEKSVKKMFPDVKWLGHLPGLISYSNMDFWWSVGGTERETAEVLKELGNAGFVEKRFTDAIRWYKLALDYDTDDSFEMNIHSNTSACFLALRCYHRALEYANKVLEKNAEHTKAIYRKTKALIGIQRYEDAGNFIDEKTKGCGEVGNNKSLVQLGVTARKFASELGNDVVDVDMVSILKMRDGIDSVDGVLEYTGPVKQSSGVSGRNKRPGLVATEDIRPGQLLLSSKAFAFTQMTSIGSAENVNSADDTEDNSSCNCFNADLEHLALVAQIAYKIHFQPEESGPEFYKLFTGPDEDPIAEDSIANRSVDMNRIHKIVEYNSFGTSFASRSRLSEENGHYLTYAGLWILPALLNYSCSESNACWSNHNDLFILRATRAIKTGEEILITVVLPSLPYCIRFERLQQDSFTCNCRLCKLDKADEEDGTAELRMELISRFICRETDSKLPHLKENLDIPVKLESLRKDNPKLNGCMMVFPIYATTILLYKYSRFEECRDLLEKLYSIEDEIGLKIFSISTAAFLMLVNLKLKDRSSLEKWRELGKKDLVAAFGTTKVVKIILLESMKSIPGLEFIIDRFISDN